MSLGFDTQGFIFHALRRSAASHTFREGASNVSIAKQGTWQSLVYLDYILTEPDNVCPLQVQFDKIFPLNLQT